MTLQTLVLMKIMNLDMGFAIRELTFTFSKKEFLKKVLRGSGIFLVRARGCMCVTVSCSVIFVLCINVLILSLCMIK